MILAGRLPHSGPVGTNTCQNTHTHTHTHSERPVAGVEETKWRWRTSALSVRKLFTHQLHAELFLLLDTLICSSEGKVLLKYSVSLCN